jgi:hypothetical protein
VSNIDAKGLLGALHQGELIPASYTLALQVAMFGIGSILKFGKLSGDATTKRIKKIL